MHIFLDTNVLFKDFFIKSNHNSKLLTIARQKEIKIYMSDVVLAELRGQYKDELKSLNDSLYKVKSRHERWRLEIELPSDIDVDLQLAIFDSFYNNLVKDGIIEVIKSQPKFMPEIIRRWTDNVKPFSKGKSEFKDTIIWLNYAEQAKRFNQDITVLITNNKSDFYDKDTPSKVHPELLVDCNNFTIYPDAYHFLKEESEKLDMVPLKFKLYIDQLNITNDYILRLLEKNFHQEIQSFACNELESRDPATVFKNEYYTMIDSDAVEANKIYMLKCESYEVVIVNDEAIISGVLLASSDVDAQAYNTMHRIDNDPPYIVAGSGNIDFHVCFTFIFERDEQVKSIELNDFIL